MTTNPTPADVERLIAEAEAALEGVTDGPWLERDTLNCTVSTEEGWNIGYYIAKGDRKFIAWARNNVPALIAALRAMQAERDDLSDKLEIERFLTDGVLRRAEAAEAKLAEVEKERDDAVVKRAAWELAAKTAEATVATLTAQVEAMRGAEWKPIETAPRDGTEILTIRSNGFIAKAQWYDNPFGRTDTVIEPQSGKWWSVTHWMPLPPMPAALTTENQTNG